MSIYAGSSLQYSTPQPRGTYLELLRQPGVYVPAPIVDPPVLAPILREPWSVATMMQPLTTVPPSGMGPSVFAPVARIVPPLVPTPVIHVPPAQPMQRPRRVHAHGAGGTRGDIQRANDRLRRQLEEAKRTKGALKVDRVALRRDASQLTTQLELTKAYAERLMRERDEIEKELSDTDALLRRTREFHRRESDELTKELSDTDALLRRTREDHSRESDELTKEIVEEQEARKRLLRERDEIEKELRETDDLLRRTRENHLRDSDELTKEIVAEQEANKRLVREKAQVEEKMRTREASLRADHVRETDELAREIVKEQMKNADLAREKDTLEKDLNAKERLLRDYVQDLEANERAMIETDTRMREEREAAQGELRAAKAQLEQAESKYVQERRRAEVALRDQSRTHADAIGRLRDAHKASHDERKKAVAERDSMYAEREKCEDTWKALKLVNNRVEQEILEKIQTIRTLRERLKDRDEVVTKIDEKIGKLRNDKRRLVDMLVSYSQQLEQQQQEQEQQQAEEEEDAGGDRQDAAD